MLKTMPSAMDVEDDSPLNAFSLKTKPEDFALETKKIVEESQSLVSVNRIEEAVSRLLSMEKKARLGGDHKSVEQCCLVILKIFERQRDYENLTKFITLLCKRRGQTEGVQTAIISFGAKQIVPNINKNDSEQAEADQEAVIKTLREISAGKMMVENIRAELTKTLAGMKEKRGNLKEACNILQEETPETYTTMEKRDKTDYLLEQVRLCLEVNDFVRANIIAKKVDRPKLEQFEDLKVKFYGLLIRYHTHERNALELARAHLQLYKTKSNKDSADVQQWKEELKSALIMLAAAPYGPKQNDLILNILNDQKLEKLPEFKSFIYRFVTDEVAQWPLPEHRALIEHSLLESGEKAFQTMVKTKKSKTLNVFDLEQSDSTWIYKRLYDGVIEHDIRIVAKYYTRIYTDRLANMLQLTGNKVEEYVAAMVTASDNDQENTKLCAKIDRAEGIIDFQPNMSPEAYLTNWTDKISELLQLVDKTCHLIHRDAMVHQTNI